MAVLIGPKTPLLVFAHGARNPVDPNSIRVLAEEVSDALHRLIRMARKS